MKMMRKCLCLLLTVLILLGAAAPVFAAEKDALSLGEQCLSAVPPDYENAALYFRRAGAKGDAAGYYRLAELYEQGLLHVGDPCTDDLDALNMAEARKYYALAAQGGYAPAQEKLADAWRQISQDEAKRIMEEEKGYLLLDVRTLEEYDAGHIPGAVCVPVESIDAPPEELPDFDQTILVYCRSGRRSKLAAEQLAGMGYTDIREFGGIIDWTGETVTTAQESPAHNG